MFLCHQSAQNEVMCPGQAQIPAVTGVSELMGESSLALYLFALFSGDSQGLLQAVVKAAGAVGFLHR